MAVAVDIDTSTMGEVEADVSLLPPVPCEMLGHDEYGDGPAQYRAVLRHDECGRADLTLMCEGCLIVTAHSQHAWRCIRCEGVVHGDQFVTNVARLLGRA